MRVLEERMDDEKLVHSKALLVSETPMRAFAVGAVFFFLCLPAHIKYYQSFSLALI